MNEDTLETPPISFKRQIVEWISARPLIKTFVSFMALGVATNLFGGLFNLWGIAIRNASKGFLRKLCDTYIIRAATTELSDSASGFVMVVSFALLFFLWLFEKFLVLVFNQRKADFVKITSSDSSGQMSHKRENADELMAKYISKMKKQIDKDKRELIIWKWLFRLICIFVLYTLSLYEISYALVKGHRQDMIKVRPFITDAEFYMVEREWVMMKSLDDYKALYRKISEFEGRETPKNPEDVR